MACSCCLNDASLCHISLLIRNPCLESDRDESIPGPAKRDPIIEFSMLVRLRSLFDTRISGAFFAENGNIRHTSKAIVRLGVGCQRK